ncbi:hypothetical protein THOM_2734 [Trachipleistophora hominis]|uniref:Uncharacterized protein n=1 Tax=Trachipleistophora hominis TaxID=72359 RepID=L7JTJ6_TRAHO|nr:hypothetical protein THOM_2734 [Trachipleistophora hominis]
MCVLWFAILLSLNATLNEQEFESEQFAGGVTHTKEFKEQDEEIAGAVTLMKEFKEQDEEIAGAVTLMKEFKEQDEEIAGVVTHIKEFKEEDEEIAGAVAHIKELKEEDEESDRYMCAQALMELDWKYVFDNDLLDDFDNKPLINLLQCSYTSYTMMKNVFIGYCNELQGNRKAFTKMLDCLEQDTQDVLVRRFNQQLQGPASGRYRVFLNDRESTKRRREWFSDDNPRGKTRKVTERIVTGKIISALAREETAIREKTYELVQKNLLIALMPVFMNEELTWTDVTMEMLFLRIERLVKLPLAWDELNKIMCTTVSAVLNSHFLKNALFGLNASNNFLEPGSVLSRFHFQVPKMNSTNRMPSRSSSTLQTRTVEEPDEQMMEIEPSFVKKTMFYTSHNVSYHSSEQDDNVALLKKECELKHSLTKLNLLECLMDRWHVVQTKTIDEFKEQIGMPSSNKPSHEHHERENKPKEETKESDEYNQAIDALASLLND